MSEGFSLTGTPKPRKWKALREVKAVMKAPHRRHRSAAGQFVWVEFFDLDRGMKATIDLLPADEYDTPRSEPF